MLADCNPKQGNYPIIKAACFLSLPLFFFLSLSPTPFPGWVCSHLHPTCLISHRQEAPALQLSRSQPGHDWAELMGSWTIGELTTLLLTIATNLTNQVMETRGCPSQGHCSEKQEVVGWFLLWPWQ